MFNFALRIYQDFLNFLKTLRESQNCEQSCSFAGDQGILHVVIFSFVDKKKEQRQKKGGERE